ncbi:dye-decolorizing heme-containing peroxidase [Kalmusia sp. IMI 367209]|nr:dye-decolorizing heme-containing peroxidase [Kalmusia sp. IMI 367209]
MSDQDFRLSNVQGDILVGLSKKTEIFFFFHITNATAFQTQLKNLVPLITTADQATGEKEAIRRFRVQRRSRINGDSVSTDDSLLSVTGVNIAFSQKGLVALSIADATTDVLKDELFFKGQKDDAFALGDKGVGDTKETFQADWDEAFLQQTGDIHGVILIAGDSFESVSGKLEEVKGIFSAESIPSITEVATLAGDVRPGNEKGHEHFGYKDGISQPAIKGVDDVDGKTPLPGQTLVNQGFLLDSSKPIEDDFPDAPTPADILGARMVGRWKSGAPLRITPLVDDAALADDPLRNNKFKFNPNSQEMCPFAAHIRKMNPRKDLTNPENTINPHLILRRGIPFGPEITTEEKLTRSTKHERGLYFVSYQSDLNNGFSFLQKRWANSPTFPPNVPVVPGFDPIIGQVHGEDRKMSGHNDDVTTEELQLERQWVQSREAIASIQTAVNASSLDIEALVPSTEISQTAYKHAASLLHPSILNHSIRLYLYTKTLAASRKSIYYTDPAKHDQLFVACLFHDIGTTETYNGDQRFEVEGADAAVGHLSQFGVGEEDSKQVWYTIALHTTKGIVHRMGELPALMRRALDIEFGNVSEVEGVDNVVELKAELNAKFPRLEIEKVLGDAVAVQAIMNPAKAPSATWPGGLYRSHLENPSWEGVNKAW